MGDWMGLSEGVPGLIVMKGFAWNIVHNGIK